MLASCYVVTGFELLATRFLKARSPGHTPRVRKSRNMKSYNSSSDLNPAILKRAPEASTPPFEICWALHQSPESKTASLHSFRCFYSPNMKNQKPSQRIYNLVPPVAGNCRRYSCGFKLDLLTSSPGCGACWKLVVSFSACLRLVPGLNTFTRTKT